MKMADSPASPVKSFGNSEEANPIDPPNVTMEKVGKAIPVLAEKEANPKVIESHISSRPIDYVVRILVDTSNLLPDPEHKKRGLLDNKG